MTPAVYQKVATAMEKVIRVSGGPEAFRQMYRHRTQNRLVWDTFFAADSIHPNLYNMACDDDIETTLFGIAKQLGLIK